MTIDDHQIFNTGDEMYGNATLGFAADGLHLYAYGYRRAAEVLLQHVTTNHTSLDVLVYPVIFLYRHHLELALKLIIREARTLLHAFSTQKSEHRLPELWTIAKELVNRVTGCQQSGLEAVDRAISQIALVDPRSTTFRYPEGMDGTKPLAGLTNINFFTLRDALEPAFDLLDGMHTILSTPVPTSGETTFLSKSV